jgi:aspartate-semialdehyde dehydrogenase
VVSTYQSITGTGVKAVEQLENEYAGVQGEMAYKYLFIEMQFHNVMCLKKTDTKEEMKLVRETQKILDDKTIVTATAVRVPIVGGHSEAVNVQFSNDFEVSDIQSLLHHTDGVVVQDNNDIPIQCQCMHKEKMTMFFR